MRELERLREDGASQTQEIERLKLVLAKKLDDEQQKTAELAELSAELVVSQSTAMLVDAQANELVLLKSELASAKAQLAELGSKHSRAHNSSTAADSLACLVALGAVQALADKNRDVDAKISCLAAISAVQGLADENKDLRRKIRGMGFSNDAYGRISELERKNQNLAQENEIRSANAIAREEKEPMQPNRASVIGNEPNAADIELTPLAPAEKGCAEWSISENMIQKAEENQLRKWFDSIDSDGSGLLGRSELAEAMREMGKTEEEVQGTVSALLGPGNEEDGAQFSFEQFKIAMRDKDGAAEGLQASPT